MQPLTHTLTAHALTDVEVADRGRRATSWTGPAPVLRPSRAPRPHRRSGRFSVDGRADGHNEPGRAPLAR
jgi:hypothetical protein